MTMTEILDAEKQRVLSELAGEKTPAEASLVLARVLDRVLIRYNTDEEAAARRAAASRMTEAAKAFVPAVDCVGGTKVWERAADGEKKKKKKGPGFFPLLFLILGLGAVLFGVGAWIWQTMGLRSVFETFLENWWMFLIPLLGGLLLLLAGRLWRRKNAPSKKEQKVEVFCDPEKLYRILHAVTLVMDRELKNVAEGGLGGAGEPEKKVLSNAELQLYSNILEAGYASEEEGIRECVEDLKFFLHRMGIEVRDYDEKHSGWFEKMPGAETGTVRPALVSGDTLLQRGLVAGA